MRLRLAGTLGTSALFAALTTVAVVTSHRPSPGAWPISLLLFVPAVALGQYATALVRSLPNEVLRRLASNALFALPSFLLMAWLAVPQERGLRAVLIIASYATLVYALFGAAWDVVMPDIGRRRHPSRSASTK